MQNTFYSTYSAYKDYGTPALSGKDVARYDVEIWKPASFAPHMACLEIGCGTGEFLSYLAHKGVADFTGIDHDPALQDALPAAVAGRFRCADVWAYLDAARASSFDRVVMLDVLEHFSSDDGVRLLGRVGEMLRPGGKVVVKVPNVSSPWGMRYQYGDLTHKTAYTPESLRQLGIASGLIVDRVYDQRRGSRRRRFTDAVVCRFLTWALLAPPAMWGPNIYCIYSR